MVIMNMQSGDVSMRVLKRNWMENYGAIARALLQIGLLTLWIIPSNTVLAATNTGVCASAVIQSFKISGKKKVKSPKGDSLYRLALQGVIRNQGKQATSLLAEIFVIPQGARRKMLKKLRINRLMPGKSSTIRVLSPPLSVAIEFFPKYSLGIQLLQKTSAKCQKANNNAKHLKIIQRQQVLRALRHR